MFKAETPSSSSMPYSTGNQSQSSILSELRTFLSLSNSSGKAKNPEFTRSAIYLLQTLPVARDGVLEHLYNLFDEAVNNYVLKLELEDKDNIITVTSDDVTIEEVRGILSDFIKTNPEAWSPIIFKWALDLLGYLSRKYSDRRIVPHSSSLPEILQLWMACCPTRALVDMTTQCLITLITTKPDMCIDILLETSVQYTPHFDWVVAHIGSCFPLTVITRVLACGLRDFCQQLSGRDSIPAVGDNQPNIPKLISVVGILGHLANQHAEDIRRALVTLFQNALVENPDKEQLSTLPFLLNLASMSNMLLQVISAEFTPLLTPKVLNALCEQSKQWKSGQVPGTDGVIRMMIHLLLKSEKWGMTILQQLLKTAMIAGKDNSEIAPEVCEAAGLLLDSLLMEIQQSVHSGKLDTPLLQGLKDHVLELCQYIKRDSTDASYVLNLLKFVCLQGGENVSVSVLGELLCIVDGNQEFSDFLHLLHYIQLSQPTVLVTTVSSKIAEMKLNRIKEPVRLLDNLAFLVQLESQQCHEVFLPNLDALAVQVAHSDLSFAGGILQLLAHCICPEAMSMSSLLRVSSAIVSFIFRFICTHQQDDSFVILKVCRDLLSTICRHIPTQHALLRMLLEGLLHPEHVVHFGAIVELQRPTTSGDKFGFSLLKENRKHATSVTVPQSHSSVFHAGIIGDGLRAQWKGTLVCKDVAYMNRQIITEILLACGAPPTKPGEKINTNGIKALALIMLELVSPDVMFNGLPWPDEEFMKVTIERDLHIKKLFEENIILWDVLQLIATFHPCLCYCSVLLRALAAVCISYWSSCQDKVTTSSPKQLDMSQKVIEVMALGQLLPPSLGAVSEILPFLTPFETYCLLSDIWQFMKDFIPSPALFTIEDSEGRVWRTFTTPDPKYTNRLRFILVANIQKLGEFYGRFFEQSSSILT